MQNGSPHNEAQPTIHRDADPAKVATVNASGTDCEQLTTPSPHSTGQPLPGSHYMTFAGTVQAEVTHVDCITS